MADGAEPFLLRNSWQGYLLLLMDGSEELHPLTVAGERAGSVSQGLRQFVVAAHEKSVCVATQKEGGFAVV